MLSNCMRSDLPFRAALVDVFGKCFGDDFELGDLQYDSYVSFV